MDIGVFLKELRGGITAAEFEDGLREVAQQVDRTGKVGTLGLTITVKPAGSGRFVLDAVVSSKAPQVERGTTLFFLGESGELTRNQPGQVSLSLLRELEEERK